MKDCKNNGRCTRHLKPRTQAYIKTKDGIDQKSKYYLMTLFLETLRAKNEKIPNQKTGKEKKITVLDLDITSLLDILVILLVFLIKELQFVGVVFNVPKDISLPSSEFSKINNAGVIVQVSTNRQCRR